MSVSALLDGILDISVKKIRTRLMESFDNMNIISVGDLNIESSRITLKGNVITEGNSYCGRSNTGAAGSIKFTLKRITPNAIIMLTAINGGPDDNLSYTSVDGSFTVVGPNNQEFSYCILQF